MDIKQNTQNPDVGRLLVSVTAAGSLIPIENASIEITYTGDPVSTIEQLTTNEIGRTETIELPAPPVEYSLEPDPVNQPYSEFNIKVSANGYEPAVISGAQLLSGEETIQPIELRPLSSNVLSDHYAIPPHTLYGDYPPKIAESIVKPINETGEIVLSRVVIPEFIIVHDGVSTDAKASDYYVRYTDYIKNVVSSEIYATWPEETIRANILAILSFTMNRVYTEWYRSKGYDFTITSSTAFDQKFVPGRNIYDNIDRLVDEMFNSYLSKPAVTQPLFTWYCDGKRVSCENGLSQWGSKYLGEEGYTPIQILRYYYGSSLFINSAETVSGIPASWPGVDLTIGSKGSKVRMLQEQLNRISDNYPLLPKITADGSYGEKTEAAVKAFQKIFNLPQDGIVDYPTWYKISNVYVGVTRISEPY